MAMKWKKTHHHTDVYHNYSTNKANKRRTAKMFT